MCFIPVDLSFMDRTILDANGGQAFQLLPITLAETLFEVDKVTNPFSAGDRLDPANWTDDLKRLPDVHS